MSDQNDLRVNPDTLAEIAMETELHAAVGGRFSLVTPSEQHYVLEVGAPGFDSAPGPIPHAKVLGLPSTAPGRPRGPACRMDLQYHLVLSFRAFVADVQISSWRGLTGSYPSRLFVLPLNRVVDEYTRVELRSLSSTPLQLQRDEVAALLRQAARLHWSYDGRYYFISNNCAVETWKLLHEGVPGKGSQGPSSEGETCTLAPTASALCAPSGVDVTEQFSGLPFAPDPM
jgi:hypothetical protein